VRTRGLFTILLLAVPFGVTAPGGQPQPDPKVKQTLADWKARLGQFQSVRYTISGVTETVNKIEISPKLKDSALPEPPRPKEKRLDAKLLIDIANKRFRLEETEPVPSLARDRWVPRLRITAYNGQAYQTAFPREKNDRGPEESDMSLSKGNLGAMEFAESHLWPAFTAHGLVPTVNAPLRMDRLPPAHEPEDFEVRGTVAHAGRQCVVLKTVPAGTTPNMSDEFWVDPFRQSAILRHIKWQGKNPWFRLDVEYTQTPHGWLPKKWTDTHTVGGRVMTITRLNVDSVDVNPSLREEEFTLPIEPGMILATYDYPVRGKGLDPTRPAKGKYRVGPGGEWEELEPQTGFTTTEGVQLPPDSGRRWLWWVLGVAAIIMVAFAGVRAWRRRVFAR
jgi:hypothetical protein